ncbi:MAG: hypothetical protein H6Q23_438 [Bacteroidetes bacterium]|nr:hypothetical protein [Bacteroidota bacterium]
MKRMVLLFFVLTIAAGIVSGQKLLDIYKNGPVKLVAEKTYGVKNNWESLFNLYYDTITKNVGPETDKKIIVAPDGSVFMSHRNRHEIWKFGPDGNFIKKFGTKGGKADQFPYMPNIQPVVDNKYIFTSDVQGRLKFFDLDGNFYKYIKLDYMTGRFQPIGNGMVLMEGNVLWKTNWRRMIEKLNIYTGETTIIHEYFTDRGIPMKAANVDSLIKEKKEHPNFRIPEDYLSSSYGNVTLLPDGQFIKADRSTGEFTLFNPAGKELSKAKMEIDPVKITEDDVQENYKMMKNSIIRSIEAYRALISADNPMRRNNPDWSAVQAERALKNNQKWLDNIDIYKDIKNYYPYFPFFSNIITDDEGNLLVFEYTNTGENESNFFNVIAYDSNGKKIARTSFVCDEYDLSFSDSKLVISKGYVYAVARLKNTAGMPLRLVKLKITN